MRRPLALLPVVALLLGALAVPAASAHYVPVAGDHLQYHELITTTNGFGNYSGYTDQTVINGGISVGAVAANGTESATYQYTEAFSDNQGDFQNISSSGAFTFSAQTDRYVNGTDNQTGYTDPYVWFYMNNSLPVGSTFYLLNSEFTVESLNTSFATPLTSTGYGETIYALGTGSYQRNDAYGVFTASYTWKEYFDPATGYVAGYVYTEQDSDGPNGFTYTDTLTVTSASYTLVATSAPPATGGGSGSGPGIILLAAIGLVVVLVVVVVVVAVIAARRRARLPRHAGPIGVAPAPWAPPPVSLGAASGPAPQVILRETVKVPCAYCGTLIDSTATVCPKCGAPRT